MLCDSDVKQTFCSDFTAGRSPIFLTERPSQVDEFATRLTGLVKHIVVLKGGMGAKQRRAIAEQLTAIPDEKKESC